MKNIVYCGIIDGCMSISGNSKVIFNDDFLVIDGGLLYDVTYRVYYNNIKLVYYSTIVPKIKFLLQDGDDIVKLSVHVFQLSRILKILTSKDIRVQRLPLFKMNIFRWFNFWYT